MSWIPLVKAAVKYALHPYALLSWINKDYICGSRIGADWYVDDTSIQEYIGEHHSVSKSDERALLRCLKEQEDKINKEIKKGRRTLFTLCSLSICSPIFEMMLRDMSELINDAKLRDIFYSLSTGVSKEEIAHKWNIPLTYMFVDYRRSINCVLENWQTTTDCRNKVKELTIRCSNYKQAMENRDLEEELPNIDYQGQEIPIEAARLLRTPLEKLEISIKIVRVLRRNNLYLLEDLLRFIKKNGFGGVGKLQNVGPQSSMNLLEKLVEIGIMEGKDSCYLFPYLIV